MSVTYDFSNKVIMITGAASGFGRLAASRFAIAGARLSLSDRNGPELASFVGSLWDDGIDALGQTVDVTTTVAVESWTEATMSRFGRIDIAINNAGLGHDMSRLALVSEEDFDRNVAVNLKGVFLCMRQQLPVMEKQGEGVIVNVSSSAGLIGAPMLSAYSAAKHGVIGLSKSAALEYASRGIRVNALCPAFSPTPLIQDALLANGEKMRRNIEATNPMHRLVEPGEVIDGLMWLCSGASSYVNGIALPIDGGLTAA